MNLLGLSNNIWVGAILGAVVIPLILAFGKRVVNWWVASRPRKKVLGSIADNSETCTIFVRDFLLPQGSQILAKESASIPYGVVPNVHEFWADVDGMGMSYAFNALGQVGKRHNIRVVRMSQDTGIWDTNLIVIGAQAKKNFDFYSQLESVMYKMDANDIIDMQTGQCIKQEKGYGYGIILKARNQFKTKGSSGVGFLIGGFGTLGTKAAAYYFSEHLAELGKEFSSKCFGIVVRASVTGGEQTVERLPQYDKVA